MAPVTRCDPAGHLSTETPACTCAGCGHTFDAASALEGEAIPREGDLTLCIRCGAVYAFRADLTVRPVGRRELRSAAYREQLPDLARARAAIEALRRAN